MLVLFVPLDSFAYRHNGGFIYQCKNLDTTRGKNKQCLSLRDWLHLLDMVISICVHFPVDGRTILFLTECSPDCLWTDYARKGGLELLTSTSCLHLPHIEIFLSFIVSLRFLSWRPVGFSQKPFLHILRWSYDFSPWVHLWITTFIDYLSCVKPFLHFWMKTTWSWWMKSFDVLCRAG